MIQRLRGISILTGGLLELMSALKSTASVKSVTAFLGNNNAELLFTFQTHSGSNEILLSQILQAKATLAPALMILSLTIKE